MKQRPAEWQEWHDAPARWDAILAMQSALIAFARGLGFKG